jgi:hypothetical protein
MKRFFLALTALFLLCGEGYACTSAIVAAQRSSEGVPILWKHRDNSFDNTRIEYVDEYGYAYTAVTKNMEGGGKYVYAGINEAGLGFITTATSNMPAATVEEYKACKRRRMRGGTTWNGLTKCATVDEFEELLRKTKRGRKSKSNIGVADATGAVAYFEVWDLDYRRYDANDSGNNGFDVRANFSHAGNPEKKGASERRYNLIMREMGKHKGDFTPQGLIGYSRSYNSIKYGNVLASEERYVCANHTVPRASTVGSFVVVCDGENPRMLAINGHSVSGLAVPVYVKAKRDIPQCVKGDAMRLLSNDFKAKAYVRESGKSRVLNKDLVRKVLRIKQPKIKMPQQLPSNIRVFNAEIDKKFAVYETKVRKVLDK